MSSQTQKARICFYIDGFNLYHAIDSLGQEHLKWINLHTLAQTFLQNDEVLVKVEFFTAILHWNKDKQARHKNFVAALKASGVEVNEGNFKKGAKYCKTYDRHCDFYEEKQTDVAIAVKMLADAYEDVFDKAILITADTDQLPTVRHIRSKFPKKSVVVATPPGRREIARELCAAASSHMEISAGRLGNCRLPRNVLNAKGKTVATMPAKYAK